MRSSPAPDDALRAGEERRDAGGRQPLPGPRAAIRQRTQAINALRGHLTEFGQVVLKGAANVSRLVAIIEDPANGLPEQAATTLRALVEVITSFDTQIAKLDADSVIGPWRTNRHDGS